jgi:hypothetical protein
MLLKSLPLIGVSWTTLASARLVRDRRADPLPRLLITTVFKHDKRQKAIVLSGFVQKMLEARKAHESEHKDRQAHPKDGQTLKHPAHAGDYESKTRKPQLGNEKLLFVRH